MFAKIQRIHFVGIGGIGMSGIAEVLLNLGYQISGSDLKNSAVTQRLAALGAAIFEGHAAANIAGSDVVVTSSAISVENPEVAEARRLHVPVIQRAEMLAELMRLKYGIAIAGMHGKTTTTSMVATVLAAGGLDPTVVVGGRVDAMGSNARLGKSQYLVAEADESDRSFLKLSPILSVVTNIDREHMDCYRDMHDVRRTFLEFMERVPFYGMVVACNDDAVLRRLLPRVHRRVTTYGTSRGSDFLIRMGPPPVGSSPIRSSPIRSSPVRSALAAGEHSPLIRFNVTYKEKDLGEFTLHVPGTHNVLNATAAIAVGIALDIPVEQIRSALDGFRGVDRRFQFKGAAAGVSVIDDYGHHPTEIRATLAAARQCGFHRVHVIFQPHRFTRTRDQMDEFSTAFAAADTLCLLDIYPASEKPIEGITAEALASRIVGAGKQSVAYAPSFSDAVAIIANLVQPDDMVLTLGAGSVSQLGAMLLERLAAVAKTELPG
ncbi:MAG: UDP-N-acetylmuramate--L-alanine ligase [Terriglobales bacterium]|jgi:UDP-N-acetylmuramate--alanine ligase